VAYIHEDITVESLRFETVVELLTSGERKLIPRGFVVYWQTVLIGGTFKRRAPTLSNDKWSLYLPLLPHWPALGDVIVGAFTDKHGGLTIDLDLVVAEIDFHGDGAPPVKTRLLLKR
jgi:hypothetical protein